MQLHELKRSHPNYKSQVVGRGGKRGKTSGRGTKGQKARAGHKIRPEWRDLIKKIPKRRGESASGSLKSIAAIVASVNVGVLDTHFTDGAKVTPKVLAEKGLIRRYGRSLPQVKVLGAGEITKKLALSGVVVSEAAKAAILKAGGSVA